MSGSELHKSKRKSIPRRGNRWVQRPIGRAEACLEIWMEGIGLELRVWLKMVADDAERKVGTRSWRGWTQGRTG